MGTLITKKFRSSNNAPNQGQSTPSGSAKLPVAGYENELHITPTGIVQQGGGVVYYENSRGELLPVVMTDSYDIIHNVVRSFPLAQAKETEGNQLVKDGTYTDEYGNPIT